MRKNLFLLFAISIFIANIVKANNVAVSAISAPDQDHVQFTLAWDNSWYVTGSNWDAIWIFVKWQDCDGAKSWDHVTLSTTAIDHTATGGLYVEVASTDGKGVFVRLNANGGGSQTGTITLKFAASIPDFAADNFEVFGIEMVWVPQGNFQVGDGSNSQNSSYASFGNNDAQATYTISTENAIPQWDLRNDFGTGGDYCDQLSGNMTVPANFPKGYTAFYCMKYEISQQQYVAFLNKLSVAQQVNRTAVSPTLATGTLAMTTAGNQNRNSIVIKTASVANAPAVYDNDLNIDAAYGDGADIACNYLSWNDLAAYLYWAALRPMTELEFEKVCRGALGSVTAEYAWGTTVITQAISTALTNGGTSTEISSTGNASAHNAGASTTIGPLRCGFAATASTTRITAGASYYGIMDLSGNVWEQCFCVGFYIGNCGGTQFPTSILYLGALGTGTIDGVGNCPDVTWNNAGISGHVISRGGNWEYAAKNTQVSDRTYYNSAATENVVRTRRNGGRGVRKL